jgi:hypothetical protein
LCPYLCPPAARLNKSSPTDYAVYYRRRIPENNLDILTIRTSYAQEFAHHLHLH